MVVFRKKRAKPGEVESERGDARLRQFPGNRLRRENVLGAGEAVGEQRIGTDRAGRQIEPRGKLAAGMTGKRDPQTVGGAGDALRGRGQGGRLS